MKVVMSLFSFLLSLTLIGVNPVEAEEDQPLEEMDRATNEEKLVNELIEMTDTLNFLNDDDLDTNYEESPSLVEEKEMDRLASKTTVSNEVLKNGDSGDRVLKLKNDLAKLGFVVSDNPNQDFGPKTTEVVKDFQKYYGLKVTGIADESTFAKIEEVLSSPFRIGQSSSAVKELKLKLAKIGYVVSDNPNNDYGPNTERVVKEFQSIYGLKVNGIADGVTLKYLDNLLKTLGGPFKAGMSGPGILKMKLDLAELGFVVSKNPNEDYGPKTTAVVKAFQREFGLEVTGEADQVTLAKIDEILSSPYRIGKSSPEVKKLKNDLAKLGFVVSNNPNNDYGPKTADVVKEFQKYYGLHVSGIAEENTLTKLKQILSSPYQQGKSSPQVKELKEDLAKLGFVVSDNPNNDYGPKTANIVKEFQKYYGLKVSGITDEVTLRKIKEIFSSSYRIGNSNVDIKRLKEDLALLGFVVSKNPNNDYGSKTEKVVKEFQEYYGLRVNGIADEITLKKIKEILSSPYREGQSSSSVKTLKQKLAKLGFIVSENPNNDYGPKTTKVVKEFQEYYGLRVNGIADEVTLRKIEEELKNKKWTIFIDPGHGGSDPGAVAGGKRESDINLVVSKKVRDILENRGYKVIMSRTGDTTVDLYDRPRMANNLGVDIFLSIHTNSGANSTHGLETYYYIYKPEYPPEINKDMHNDPERIDKSKKLANIVHKKLISYTGTNDRGVKRGAFVVTRETKMPAILIELGFISNAEERNKLTSASYQDKLAKAISDGIVEYFKLL